MTETPAPAAQPAAQPAAPPPAPTAAEPDGQEGLPQWVARAGTAAMFLAIGAVVIIGLDVLLKGRLLGPLIRRLPVPGEAVVQGEVVEEVPADDG